MERKVYISRDYFTLLEVTAITAVIPAFSVPGTQLRQLRLEHALPNYTEMAQARKVRFSAAHRLYSNQLSEEENKRTYGKCVNLHGHNYTIEVTVYGNVNPITGMVVNLVDLKDVMAKVIIDNLDHKNLEDLAYFKTHPSTAENIAIYIWDNLHGRLQNCSLYKVKVHETENNVAVYKGE